MSTSAHDLQLFSEILREIPGIHAEAQRGRMHEAMRLRGFITVFESQRYLDCPDPRARKLELVRKGVPVLLAWDKVVTEVGATHRVGKYFLARQKEMEVIE